MTESRQQQFFKPKKPADFLTISSKVQCSVSGCVWSVCDMSDDNIAVLTGDDQPYIEMFDTKTQKPISDKIAAPRAGSFSEIYRLPDGKILYNIHHKQFRFDPATKQFGDYSHDIGFFLGMLNAQEYVMTTPDGFSVHSLDGKTPVIKTKVKDCNSNSHFQILPNDTIAVKCLHNEIYRRKENAFSCVEKIDVGTHQHSIHVGDSLVVKYSDPDRKRDPMDQLIKVFRKQDGTWKPVPGLQYRMRDWSMGLKAIPGSDLFMLVGGEKIIFFDSKTLNRFSVETDFGDVERRGYREYFFHSSVTVLESGKIALGYQGLVILLTMERVKEFTDEKECKIESHSKAVLAR